MLNWRRDPDDERRWNAKLNKIEQIKIETERIRKDTELIKKDTERLKRENARERAFSALIRQHCFPDESNSTPIPPIEPDSSSS